MTGTLLRVHRDCEMQFTVSEIKLSCYGWFILYSNVSMMLHLFGVGVLCDTRCLTFSLKYLT